MNILNKSEIDASQWKELSEDSSVASYFQTKECYDFYCSLSFMEPFAFGVSENNILKGVVCGYITANGGAVKRFFSRRAIIQGGPLLSDDISDEALEQLLKYVVKQLSKKAIYVEFRNNSDYSKYRNIFIKNGFEYSAHLNYIIDTQSDDFSKNISESKRRQIKKASVAGVQVVETNNIKDIKEFYAILEKLYTEKVRKPLFPMEFFEKLVSLPNGHLFVAKYNEQVISGMACVSLGAKTVYEWFVCGDKYQFNHVYPSVAVTFSAIEYAAKNGYDKFDFMGAGRPDENYGVREFKSKFGGKLVEYGRYLRVNNKILYFLGKTSIIVSGKT